MISGVALFPGGAAGAGLLLLRFSVAGSLLALSASHFGTANGLEFIAILAIIGLCAGLQTRLLAALNVGAPILGVALGAGFVPLAILHGVNALVLVLTGPGAWSVDAVLFGRRTVKLPDHNDTIV